MEKMNQIPWKLVQNKFPYYPGGREIDKFRGVYPPKDDNSPECWIGSDITMRYAVHYGEPTRGLAKVELPDGRTEWIRDVIQKDPEAILGPEHVKAEGAKLGVLVKLLDAEKQLNLQSHPDRDFAKRVFDSDYGKEESWYVIGVRDDTEEPPYVLMGFKEGITREAFEEAYHREDLPAMEGWCHKVPVKLGDAFMISAGLPHAIGPGCFVVEVQEPSDFTVGVNPAPKEFTEEQKKKHDETQMGCYHYDGHSYEENLRLHRPEPRTIREGSWGSEKLIIGPGDTDYFSFTRLDASAPVKLLDVHAAQVGIVLEGEGKLITPEGELALSKADEFFLTYSCKDVTLVPEDGGTISLVLCKPQIFD